MGAFLNLSKVCAPFLYPHACVYDTIYPIVSFSPIPELASTFNLYFLVVIRVQARKRLTGAFLKDTLFSNCQSCKPIVKIYTLYFNARLRNYPNEVKYLIFFVFLVASSNFFNYLCNSFSDGTTRRNLCIFTNFNKNKKIWKSKKIF